MINKLKESSLTMKIFIFCFCLLLSKEAIFKPMVIAGDYSSAERILLIGTMIIAVALRGAACMQIMGLIFEHCLPKLKVRIKATKSESICFDALITLLAITWGGAYYLDRIDYPEVIFKALQYYFVIRVISILQTKLEQAKQGETM